MRHIAFYGKGGIGKTTVLSNLAILLGEKGFKILVVGCDPKHDTSYKISDTYPIPTVIDRIIEKSRNIKKEDIVFKGRHGIDCIEAGGPEPGVGCAGKGIGRMFEVLESLGVFHMPYDFVLYDVLGDVVCGGFAYPMRYSRSTEVVILTSGEFLSLYAANNLCRAIVRLGPGVVRLAGIVANLRGLRDEEKRIYEFSKRVNAEVIGMLQHDESIIEAERLKKSVVEHAPHSPASLALEQICNTILSKSYENYSPPKPMSDLGFDEFISKVA